MSRPWTRGDCMEYMPRPCPMVQCRHHLLPDSYRTDLGPGDSCALDVADRGGETLQEVGRVLGLTRERIRQIEAIALRKWRRAAIRERWLAELAEDRRYGEPIARPVRTIEQYPEGWK